MSSGADSYENEQSLHGQGHLPTRPDQNMRNNPTVSQVAGITSEWRAGANVPFQQHPSLPTFNMPYMAPTNLIRPPFLDQSLSHSQEHYPSWQYPIQTSQSFNGATPTNNHKTSQAAVTGKVGKQNWTAEEDLQLTIAWSRISTDPAVGVGQKKPKVWERVLELFLNLMQEKTGSQPDRNPGACENRMQEIKLDVSKWTGIRAQVFNGSGPQSGASMVDLEAVVRQRWADEHGGKQFKFEACWDVLKQSPKWVDYKKRQQEQTRSTSHIRRKTNQQPTETPVSQTNRPSEAAIETPPQSDTPVTHDSENILIDHELGATGGGMRRESTHSSPGVGSTVGGICTPVLSGPAAIDLEHPPGQKKAKNQRQREKRQFFEAQNAASQTFKAGILRLEAASKERWDRLDEDQRQKDERDNKRYHDEMRMMAREHELKVVKERSRLVQDLDVVGEKLISAMQRFDGINPESIITPSQQRAYQVRKRAVEYYEKLYKEMEKSIVTTSSESPSQTVSDAPMTRASQMGLDDEEQTEEIAND